MAEGRLSRCLEHRVSTVAPNGMGRCHPLHVVGGARSAIRVLDRARRHRPANDNATLAALLELLDAGFESQIVLSHDGGAEELAAAATAGAGATAELGGLVRTNVQHGSITL